MISCRGFCFAGESNIKGGFVVDIQRHDIRALWPLGLLGLLIGMLFGLLYAKGGEHGQYKALPGDGGDHPVDDSDSQPGPGAQRPGQRVKNKPKPKKKKTEVIESDKKTDS